MREIVFDTETTGLDPKTGDRLIELGAVELVNRFPTGRTFHEYVNPGRAVSQGALEVHGITDAFLADKPPFEAVVDAFLAFVGDDGVLVAHNAGFDMSFINMELERVRRPAVPSERVVDTLVLARRRHPGAANNLDALCSRYGIDNAARVKHGALLDAEILADVYIELLGGKQADLGLTSQDRGAAGRAEDGRRRERPVRTRPLPPRVTEAERTAHRAFIETIGPHAMWRKHWDAASSDS